MGIIQYENQILCGDALEKLKELPDGIVDTCVTSPPYYGLRDYGTGRWVGGDPACPHKRLNKYSEKTITGHGQEDLRGMVGDAIYKTICPLCGAVREDNQIGLEETPEEYIDKLVKVFHEVKRILKDDGTLWVNIGDSYNGSGRGRDADGNAHFTDASSKQATNKGSTEGTFQKRIITSCKHKDLIGIPWMLAFALRADGWYLRQDIIWHKPNPMPESVKDRCVKSHEYIFLLSKSAHYYFDYKAIQEDAVTASTSKTNIKFGGNKYGDNNDSHFQTYSGKTWTPQTKHKNLEYNGQQNHSFHERRAEGLPDEEYVVRNKRDVWTVSTKAVKEAHFATYPEDLIEPCILAGSRVGGGVLDPFFGSGTTGRVAQRLNRWFTGIELNPKYIEICEKRNNNIQMTMEGLI